MSSDFDLVSARRFLDAFGEGEPHTFQYFDDRSKGHDARHFTGDLDDRAEQLRRLNSLGRGIYFMVNQGDGKGRSKEHVTAVRALFVDVDNTPLQPILDASLEPHILVQSGPNSYHAYWLVDDCPLDRFHSLQKALAARFGTDDAVTDLPRVMRVPGFWNCKTKYSEPFQVKIVRQEEGLPYKLDKIIEELGLKELETQATKDRETSLPALDSLTPKCVKTGSRHNFIRDYAFKYAAQYGTNNAEVLPLIIGLNFTYCEEPLPMDEVKLLVESAVRKNPDPTDGVNLSAIAKPLPRQKPVEEIAPASPLALPVDVVNNAPGLVGALAWWIDSSLTRTQPHFALAAAIAFVGALKGHRVQTTSGSRTNHYTLAVGRSGSGKSEVNRKVNDLLRHAGLDDLRMGRPKSDSAIQTALIAKRGRAYLPWDEMGVHLEMMLSKNAPTHYAGIRAFLLEAWSSSSDVLAKSEYATAENQKGQQDIDQPCLSMYANAQPEIFYGALSSASSADGFIPRLLIFETPDNYPEKRNVSYSPPPDDIIEVCKEIQEWPTNSKPGKGNLTQLIINPRVVPFSPSAETLIAAATRDVEKLLRKNEGSITSGIWSRTMEHVHKLALTVEEGPEISDQSATWAIDLMMALSPAMCAAFSLRVSDTQVERTKKRVLQVIAAAGGEGIGASALTRKTQFLRDRREREVVLSELYESGQIVKREQAVASGRALTNYYLAGLAPE